MGRWHHLPLDSAGNGDGTFYLSKVQVLLQVTPAQLTLQTLHLLACPLSFSCQVLGVLPAWRTGVRRVVRRIRGLVHLVRVRQGVDSAPQVGLQETTNNRKQLEGRLNRVCVCDQAWQGRLPSLVQQGVLQLPHAGMIRHRATCCSQPSRCFQPLLAARRPAPLAACRSLKTFGRMRDEMVFAALRCKRPKWLVFWDLMRGKRFKEEELFYAPDEVRARGALCRELGLEEAGRTVGVCSLHLAASRPVSPRPGIWLKHKVVHLACSVSPCHLLVGSHGLNHNLPLLFSPVLSCPWRRARR